MRMKPTITERTPPPLGHTFLLPEHLEEKHAERRGSKNGEVKGKGYTS
jgi:hypothetical protein